MNCTQLLSIDILYRCGKSAGRNFGGRKKQVYLPLEDVVKLLGGSFFGILPLGTSCEFFVRDKIS
jgi:hypothetical protein